MRADARPARRSRRATWAGQPGPTAVGLLYAPPADGSESGPAAAGKRSSSGAGVVTHGSCCGIRQRQRGDGGRWNPWGRQREGCLPEAKAVATVGRLGGIQLLDVRSLRRQRDFSRRSGRTSRRLRRMALIAEARQQHEQQGVRRAADEPAPPRGTYEGERGKGKGRGGRHRSSARRSLPVRELSRSGQGSVGVGEKSGRPSPRHAVGRCGARWGAVRRCEALCAGGRTPWNRSPGKA